MLEISVADTSAGPPARFSNNPIALAVNRCFAAISPIAIRKIGSGVASAIIYPPAVGSRLDFGRPVPVDGIVISFTRHCKDELVLLGEPLAREGGVAITYEVRAGDNDAIRWDAMSVYGALRFCIS